ncbi:MAG: thioredoxin family protein [Xylophilus ampelinus]
MQEHEPVSLSPASTAPSQRPAAGPADRWRVVCLCADWCGVCRQYRADFDAVAARTPDAAFDWIDVEDEADLAGDIDVETFPTLVVGDPAGRVRFAGPMIPQPEVLSRLVASLRSAPAGAARDVGDASGQFAAMLQRLPRRD